MIGRACWWVLGYGNELVKCLECSERGRKVVGTVGKRGFESKSLVSQTDILSNDGHLLLTLKLKRLVVCLWTMLTVLILTLDL